MERGKSGLTTAFNPSHSVGCQIGTTPLDRSNSAVLKWFLKHIPDEEI